MDTYEAKIYTTLLIAAGIMALIITVFIITIIHHHKKNVSLYKEKIRAEITTLETERRRIASDLHDDLGPLLSAVKLQVNSLDVQPDDLALLQKANANMDTIVGRLREIANNLVPHVLIRKGVVSALEDFIADINLSGVLHVTATFAHITQFPPHSEIHIYRMVQEILNNALKHSGASVCSILFKLGEDKLVIEIKDNGRGFNHPLQEKNRGSGLQNVLSRAEMLKGKLFIDTRPGKGVHYLIEIPLN